MTAPANPLYPACNMIISVNVSHEQCVGEGFHGLHFVWELERDLVPDSLHAYARRSRRLRHHPHMQDLVLLNVQPS